MTYFSYGIWTGFNPVNKKITNIMKVLWTSFSSWYGCSFSAKHTALRRKSKESLIVWSLDHWTYLCHLLWCLLSYIFKIYCISPKSISGRRFPFCQIIQCKLSKHHNRWHRYVQWSSDHTIKLSIQFWYDTFNKFLKYLTIIRFLKTSRGIWIWTGFNPVFNVSCL
jgi:hypothetical protein